MTCFITSCIPLPKWIDTELKQIPSETMAELDLYEFTYYSYPLAQNDAKEIISCRKTPSGFGAIDH